MGAERFALGLIVLGLLAGAFELGRRQQGDAPAGPSQPPREVSAPPAAVKTVSTPPSEQAPLRDFDHFRVGNRNVKALLADGQTMWIGTSGGVIRYDIATDRHRVYDNKSGLLSNGIFHIHKHRQEIWIGTYGGGLSVLDLATGKWREYNIPEGLGDAFVYDVLHASNGDVWIATWSGANRIRGGRMDDIDAWELHTVENTGGGLPNDWVYALAEGKDGQVWLATEGGVARFAAGAWSHWTHAEGLGAPYALVEEQIDLRNDPGTQSRHHAQQKVEQGLTKISVAYNPNYVISLAVDKDGVVWAGTWGGGLSRFDGDNWQTLTVADGLPSNHVFMLRRGPDDKLWIGTNRGLSRYDGSTFATYSVHDGLLGDNVFSIAFTEGGETWVGSYGGIARFRGKL